MFFFSFLYPTPTLSFSFLFFSTTLFPVLPNEASSEICSSSNPKAGVWVPREPYTYQDFLQSLWHFSLPIFSFPKGYLSWFLLPAIQNDWRFCQLIYLFIHLFIHSINVLGHIHSFTIHSFIPTIHSFICSFIHSLSHLYIHSFTHSLIHLFIYLSSISSIYLYMILLFISIFKYFDLQNDDMYNMMVYHDTRGPCRTAAQIVQQATDNTSL